MDILERLRRIEQSDEVQIDAAAEIERLRKFAHWAIQEGSFSGCCLDGGNIQDKGEELGIIVRTKYDPEIHGRNDCEVEPGDTWFVFAHEQSENGK